MGYLQAELAYLDRSGLHAALADADAVVLRMPITARTWRIIDRAALAGMKPSAFLANVSRGRWSTRRG